MCGGNEVIGAALTGQLVSGTTTARQVASPPRRRGDGAPDDSSGHASFRTPRPGGVLVPAPAPARTPAFTHLVFTHAQRTRADGPCHASVQNARARRISIGKYASQPTRNIYVTFTSSLSITQVIDWRLREDPSAVPYSNYRASTVDLNTRSPHSPMKDKSAQRNLWVYTNVCMFRDCLHECRSIFFVNDQCGSGV